jgi:hypothetical protein
MSQADYQLLRQRLNNLYLQLQEIELQLLPIVARLRSAIGGFLGVEGLGQAPAPIAPPEAPGRVILAEERPAAPPPTATATLQDLLVRLIDLLENRGIRLARYRDHKFVVAKEPVTYEGNYHDLGDVYNKVLLSPTIDAQVEVDRKVEPDTPVIKAYTILPLDNMDVRTVYYKGVVPDITGKMFIWAFKY